MRLYALFALLFVLVSAVSAWEKEDHEIFDLVSEIQASEGKDTSFYSWLGVSSSATTAQISKAYRKKSMQLHPDKNPDVKGIHERFARLGVIAAILRDSEGRKRYDHFYKNGVPKWRGTGYYYSRWRPGMPEVAIFLISFTSLVQYIIQRINYKRDLLRVNQIISSAKLAAWGPKMVPVEGQRKVKIPVGGPSHSDQDGNQYGGGRMIDMIVESNGDVSVLDEAGDMHPLDTDSAVPAGVGRTWFISLLKLLFAKVVNRAPKDAESLENGDADESSETASETGSGTVTPNNEGAPAVLKAGRTAAVKAGGKRRKAVKKRS